jgi:hypothetical protein
MAMLKKQKAGLRERALAACENILSATAPKVLLPLKQELEQGLVKLDDARKGLHVGIAEVRWEDDIATVSKLKDRLMPLDEERESIATAIEALTKAAEVRPICQAASKQLSTPILSASERRAEAEASQAAYAAAKKRPPRVGSPAWAKQTDRRLGKLEAVT